MRIVQRMTVAAFLLVWTVSGLAVDVSIADFGAKGDGTTDDTAAFEQAIAAAADHGSTVRVPMGAYLLTRPLRLEHQHLLGLVAGGWNSDAIPMPTLIVGQTSGPTLALGPGASVHGIAILDDESRRMTPHPPAVSVAGQVCISNVRIQYPYDGIICSNAAENGRSNIENVFIVSPGHDGVHVTVTHDIATLRNIEVWCNLGFSEGAGFRFGHNDELHGSRLFALQCRTGFVFEEEPVKVERGQRAGTYGTFVDCTTDGCDRGWRVTGWAGLNIVGGDFWNHHAGLVLDSETAQVKICGADLNSNGEPAVMCNDAGYLILSGCTVGGASATPRPFLELHAARAVSVNGCVFKPGRPAMSVGEKVDRCVVTGNVFAEEEGKTVSVAGDRGAAVVVANNVGVPD